MPLRSQAGKVISMFGTYVNIVAVIFGTLAGVLFRKGLPQRFKDILMQAVGLAVLFIGLSTSLTGLLNPESDPLLFIISLALGSVLGELMGIEAAMERLGNRLQKRMGEKHSGVSEAFVSTSLLFCVGSMTIVGAMKSGLEGDHSILFAKSILDGVASFIFASSMGIGVIFSVFSLLIYQGGLTLLSSFLEPWISQAIIREISNVGGILIFGIGLNLLKIKVIKTGNLLPALFIPPIYLIIRSFF